MIHDPVFIIGCPRSGTTLLYNVLSEVPELWSIGQESKAIIEKHHSPAMKGWESGSLTATDVTAASRSYIIQTFYDRAAPGTFWQKVNNVRRWLRGNTIWRSIKQRGRSQTSGSAVASAVPQQGMNMIARLASLRNRLEWRRPDSIRLLEKTPENCLRLPFLLELFPDARIIYLVRDGRSNVNSLIEGWRQPHLFPGYAVPHQLSIPDYERTRWAFSLIPGWQELAACPLAEICAWQWIRCNEFVLQHRAETEGIVPYLSIRYESLIASPANELSRLADFLGVTFSSLQRYEQNLPHINVVSKPDTEKWKSQNLAAIEAILPLIAPMMTRLGYDVSSV